MHGMESLDQPRWLRVHHDEDRPERLRVEELLSLCLRVPKGHRMMSPEEASATIHYLTLFIEAYPVIYTLLAVTDTVRR